MIHDNDRVSLIEAEMQRVAREELAAQGFAVLVASEVPQSSDFLHKIISLIQSCGFGLAIFSDATPARTVGNIFFEYGYCLALGKPTQLVFGGDHNSVPSDFVRTEWRQHDGDFERLRGSLREIVQGFANYADFVFELARAAEEAEEPDFALAYERFRRSYLIDGHERSSDGVRRIQARLRGPKKDVDIGKIMRANRRNLSDEISNFLRQV